MFGFIVYCAKKIWSAWEWLYPWLSAAILLFFLLYALLSYSYIGVKISGINTIAIGWIIIVIVTLIVSFVFFLFISIYAFLALFLIISQVSVEVRNSHPFTAYLEYGTEIAKNLLRWGENVIIVFYSFLPEWEKIFITI